MYFYVVNGKMNEWMNESSERVLGGLIDKEVYTRKGL